MKRFFIISIIWILTFSLFCDELRYRYGEWQDYKIITETEEDVYVNDTYWQRGSITSKAAFTYLGMENGIAEYDAELINLEKTQASWGETLDFSEEHFFHFYRDERGIMELDPPSLYPVLRNLLVLPEGSVFPGQSWEFTGYELHDGTQSFSVDYFSFPRTVTYTYKGDTELDGETYQLIETESQYKDVPQLSGDPWGYSYPIQVEGFTNRKIYWDKEQGRPVFVEESFIIGLYLADLRQVVYDGTRISRYEYAEEVNREQEIEDVENILKDKGIIDTEVTGDDEGLILTMKQVHFYPDSAAMLPDEAERIHTLAEILSHFPNRDILITGHTADYGVQDPVFQQELSLERAHSVSEKLQTLLGDRPGLFITRGMGGTQPIADNNTEEGRSLNRRVEIKVLDN